MNVFETWEKITPLSDRFLQYAGYYNFGRGKKLKLADVLGGNIRLTDEEYSRLCVELALKGYELKAEGQYFKLLPGELLKQVEELRAELEDASKTIEFLRSENESLKSGQYRKAGQKSFNDKTTVTLIYDSYLKGDSLAAIVEELNNKGYKTKRGGQWHKSTVKFILQNHEYVDRGYIEEGAFQEVQESLKNKRLGKR